MSQVKEFFEGDGPTLINGTDGTYFSCEGCLFHNPTPKQKDGIVYQVNFCAFHSVMGNRRSDQYIGRESTTPDWCPILKDLED